MISTSCLHHRRVKFEQIACQTGIEMGGEGEVEKNTDVDGFLLAKNILSF
jgi:hypothetical protein